MDFNRNIMKRIIYFISVVSVLALYSCEGQYDNIEQYATDESVYVGKYDGIPDSAIKIGYKRVEIDLMNAYGGRIPSNDIYLGKAKKTVVEFDEPDGPRRREFTPVSSWVNITDLPTQKTYIFSIYTEDSEGHKSIAEKAMARPFTDIDLEGIAFPLPYTISSPTTMEFRWTEDSGVSSSLFHFAELTYSYTDRDGNRQTGKLTSTEAPRFSITNLTPSDNIPITVTCRIIPIMESAPILDTVTMVREFFAKTASEEDYLSARTLRQIKAANISPDNLTQATIKWDALTDHLVWTEVRYEQTDGTFNVIRVANSESETVCPNVKRGTTVQFRSAFNPPQTADEFVSEWTNYESSFLIKYDRRDWVVLDRYGNFGWASGGDWNGGNPMLILDDNVETGWHTRLQGDAMPQLLIVDMKKTNRFTKVVLETTNDGNYGYWNNIEIYVTNELPFPGYTTHTVRWEDGRDVRTSAYDTWRNEMKVLIPGTLPVASWGAPAVRVQTSRQLSFPILFPQTMEGQYLIIMFPDNNTGGWANYINVGTLEMYDE
jgi:hypothetical protein